MAFADKQLIAGVVGKTVSGLALTKTAAMTLEVATGTVTTHNDGVAHTLAAAVSHVFTADGADVTRVFMALIDNGVSVDVWIDAYVDDGLNRRADIPAGFTVIAGIAWFSIAASETDLDNSTINRRTWV